MSRTPQRMTDDHRLHARRQDGRRPGRARPSGRSRSATASRSRICAGSPEPGYRADGNCRACMVEIEGERVLAASCSRKPTRRHEGEDRDASAPSRPREDGDRAAGRRPAGARRPRTIRISKFWHWAEQVERRPRAASRPPSAGRPTVSHPAMAVNLDACIQCRLCVRACREVQVNDVIGMAFRGHDAKIVFDFDDPMGDSTCVACGECVQACPTGALMPTSLLDDDRHARQLRQTGRSIRSARTAASAASSPTTSRTTRSSTSRAATARPTTTGCASRAASASTTSTPAPADQAADPPRRRAQGRQRLAIDPANPWTHFREATWEEALDVAAGGPARRSATRDGGKALAGFGSAKGSNEEAYLFQKLVRTGFGTNNVDHCTRLCHASSVAALMEGIGSGAVSAPFTARRGRRGDHRHRRQPDREPSGRRDLHQERGEARRQADRHGPARRRR